MSRATRILKMYKRLLVKRPILVQSLQTGILVSTGDLIAQTVIDKKTLETLDLARTARFFTLGSVFLGPTLTVWYRFLSKFYGHSGKTVVLKKVATDQLLFVPCLQAAMITIINGMDGRDWKFIKEQLRLKYTDILVAGYKVWPAVQMVNFYVVPLNYQVLVVQCVALFWNTYFCWKTQDGIDKKG
ncbi:hypothetical protein JTB14_007385 [Gonioctena quinquepunctata]|nr:hypothetical protein JTB14_007385 [Gonioctena quinquepunctata]